MKKTLGVICFSLGKGLMTTPWRGRELTTTIMGYASFGMNFSAGR